MEINTESMGFYVAAIFVILLFLVLLGYLIFAYVMESLSLHTLARRRAISNPWLAWIPFGNYWIIGSLARDYDKKRGINRRWDKILLILSLICLIAFVVIYIILIAFFIGIAIKGGYTTLNDDISLEIIIPFLIIYVALIAVMVVALALQALLYICLYKIFESTVPQKSLKYFLIFLLVPFAAPICLFLCRNKGYENPDPLAYIYAPVNANNYASPAPAKPQEPKAEEKPTSESKDNEE